MVYVNTVVLVQAGWGLSASAVAWSLAAGRKAFAHRIALAVEDAPAAIAQLVIRRCLPLLTGDGVMVARMVFVLDEKVMSARPHAE